MRPSIRLDFVLYAGDPDAGAEAVPSDRAKAGDERFELDGTPQGALLIEKDGKRLAPLKPDPIVNLITKLLGTVQYVIEGEPETVLFSESDHGLALSRVSEEVQLSFFVGSDPEEPESFLLKELLIPLEDYASQIIEMADRLIALAPARFKEDERLAEYLDQAKASFKSWRLERDRVRRR